MVNFGYPYNDIVICKDSTDYLCQVVNNFVKFVKLTTNYTENSLKEGNRRMIAKLLIIL